MNIKKLVNMEMGEAIEWLIKHQHDFELTPLTPATTEGAEVALDCGVMPNGHYWINDKSRYGWEVVRILGGNLYRFGVSEACNLDKKKFQFTRLEEPK